jgi:hypothetical protein
LSGSATRSTRTTALAASASTTPTTLATLATGSATPRQFIGGDLAVVVAIHSLQDCGDVLDLIGRQRAIAVAVEQHDQWVSARTARSARTASSGSTLAALRGTVGTSGSTFATLCRTTTFAVAGSVGVAFSIGPFAFCTGPFAFSIGPFAFDIGPFAFSTGPFAFDIGPFAFSIVAFCGRLIPLGRSIGGPFVCGCWQAEHDAQAEYGGCGDQ